MFSVTEAHVVLFPLLSLCREGQEMGLEAGPGAVDRDPPTPAISSVCLLALCSVCYDPCCLGSGPSSEFGREQRPAESSPKAPPPQAARPHLCWADPFGAEPFPRTSCSSIGGPFVITRGPLWARLLCLESLPGDRQLSGICHLGGGRPGSHPGQLARSPHPSPAPHPAPVAPFRL